MASADELLVARYDSLDALFCALNARARPLFAGGDYVRVHPALLPEVAVGERMAVRERLATFRLGLVITSPAESCQVELRRYATPHEPPPGERSRPIGEAR